MKMIKTLLVILGIIIHSANHLYADIPHFIDFKFILNESDAGKKAQTALKNKLNKIFKAKNLSILDCTGGFARDAAILASLGNDVTLIERNTLIMSLLVDAREKIKIDDIRNIFSKIKIRLGNCLDFIRNTNKHFDYVYFDFKH